ncbi:MAG: TadE/TadG family type IV pilus assembly protein, partial [Gammaproteobacteria bacterium]
MEASTRLVTDERGNIGILFALMLTVMCLMTGAAVDIGTWMQARFQTEEAIDAAVLAGLQNYQQNQSTAQAIAAAQAVYAYNVASRIPVLSDNVKFTLINNNTEMTAVGDAVIKMPFLTIANVPTLPLLKTDGSELAISQAAVGSNAGQSLEVAVMIDNTGSMCESSATAGTGNCASGGALSKIAAVQQAANALVDQVIWSDQSQYTSRIALIPFSEAVNLGSSSLADAARGTLKTTGGNGSTYTCSSGGTCTAHAAANTGKLPGWQGYSVSNVYDDYNQRASAAFWASSTCVTERTGTHDYDDASPITYPVGALYNEPVTFGKQWNWNSRGNNATTQQTYK